MQQTPHLNKKRVAAQAHLSHRPTNSTLARAETNLLSEWHSAGLNFGPPYIPTCSRQDTPAAIHNALVLSNFDLSRTHKFPLKFPVGLKNITSHVKTKIRHGAQEQEEEDPCGGGERGEWPCSCLSRAFARLLRNIVSHTRHLHRTRGIFLYGFSPE